MRKHTKLLAVTVVLAAAGWFAGCNSTIDEEPNVVLEVEQLTISPVTSSANGPGGTCTFTVTAATGMFKNLPKNQFAGTSPFNDIILESVDISYVWDDFADVGPQPNATAGIGGAVPAGGSISAQFSVISNQALSLDNSSTPGNGRAGHTASLGLTFRGTTVSGESVTASSGGTLQVNSCIAIFGACCGGIISNGCQDALTQADCQSQGGTFQGPNTTCATLPNSCP